MCYIEKKRRWIILITIIVFNLTGKSQSYLKRQDLWIDSVMQSLSVDQKIGQLFMIRAYSRGSTAENNNILNAINNYHIGGVCFFQGDPLTQATLTNQYQSVSKIPLFVGLDAEWGLSMRFPKDAPSLPKQLTLGAIQNNKSIYEMGAEIAKQCKAIGVNINFAPSIDVLTNPKNPVIYNRSFGEDAQMVLDKGYMYMRGMEDEGVLACLKHFPGHGDTKDDSHHTLPTITHELSRLTAVEMYPFKRLAALGANAIMVGHIYIPAIDSTKNRPMSLSANGIQFFIRRQMGFDGLVISDALDMGAITKNYKNGDAELEALIAGNDVLLLPNDYIEGINKIKQALADSVLTIERLNQSVERILRAKYKLGLHTMPIVNTTTINEFIQRNQLLAIKEKLITQSITVISDLDNQIPIRNHQNKKIATISFNTLDKTAFQKRVSEFVTASHHTAMPHELKYKKSNLLRTLSGYDLVLLSLHTSGRSENFAEENTTAVIGFIQELQKNTKVIVTVFGNPFTLANLGDIKNIVFVFDNDKTSLDIAAQSVFGVNDINGKLPISISSKYPIGTGLFRGNLGTLGYGLPESVGMSSSILNKIDSTVQDLILHNGAPGGQVLVAKDGKIVYQKSFGKLSYDGYYVSNNTIYDIASVTKILATTIATMKLVDEKKINIKSPLYYYLPNVKETNKKDFIIQDILAHHSKLNAGILTYEKTLLNKPVGVFNKMYYSKQFKDGFTVPVADKMFLRSDYRDTIWNNILKSSIRPTSSYRYSDLGFYLLQRIIENESGKKLNEYAAINFYQPLGLRHTGYLPLENHLQSGIAPTEIDKYFRYQTIQGYVHDMGAAMLGGVGGHAGLFSNSKDMAVIMQMLLNKGSYAGIQYIKPETVQTFTTRYERSTRRGLGFDMKELNPAKRKNMSSYASSNTYGHTGFTGSVVYADPDHNLIYIFNTNRTYPSRFNQTLANRNTRNAIQAIIYKSINGFSTQQYL